MPFAKLTNAIYDSNSCCAKDFLTKNNTIKKVQVFTDASDRAVKKWRRQLREGKFGCENSRDCSMKCGKEEG